MQTISVEDIKGRIAIETYIMAYVSLKKRGNTYEACCPFHNEKHPSFKVNPSEGIWKCFGSCQEGGDVFAFAMKYHGWDFPTALRELAAYAGIIEPVNGAPAPARPPRSNPSMEIAEPPTDEWQARAGVVVQRAIKTLWDLKRGADAMHYLTEKRGLSRELLYEARIGYIPPKDEIELRYGKVVDEHWLKEDGKPVRVPCGVTIPHYAGGKLWALRVRTQSGDPKYMGLTGGSKALYWSDNVVPGYPVVLVEGEFDALAIWQSAVQWFGLLYPVALASASNWEINRRWWKVLQGAPVVLARMDADAAGQKALAGLQTITAAIKPIAVPDPAVKDCNDYLLSAGALALVEWLELEAA